MSSRDIAEAISAGLNSLTSIVQNGTELAEEETALSIGALRRMEDALNALELGLQDGTIYGPIPALLPGEVASVRAVRQALEVPTPQGDGGSVFRLAEQCLFRLKLLFDSNARTEQDEP